MLQSQLSQAPGKGTESTVPRIADPSQIKDELDLLGPDEIRRAVAEKTVDPVLEAKASDFFNKLMLINVGDVEKRQTATDSIEGIADNVEKRATDANHFLSQPL